MAAPHKMLVNLDMAQHAILRALFDPLTADPATPVNGQFWYRTDLDEIRFKRSARVDTIAFVSDIASGSINGSLWNANTLIKADADNTPVALEIPANTFVGRGVTGGISGLSVTQVKTLLSIPGTGTLATTADVSAAVANLVGSAPEALNALDELSTALGNDPNFATSITNSLAAKVQSFGALIGDGSAKTFTVVHGFNSQKCIGAVYEINGTELTDVDAARKFTSGGYVIEFEDAPTASQYRVTVLGVA